ncbi:MBL fold metallo-hydrolase [Peribacillus butanolivorans]|uniref:MBL fold metallo-hydrolase n=1 Tax=Peribacillus butanolivorans TaxID=421767 RepID=UPI00364A7E59
MKNFVVEKGKKWRVGNVTIDLIFEVQLEFSKNEFKAVLPTADFESSEIKWLTPDYITNDGNVLLNEQSFLIKSKGKNILIDTGTNTPGPFEDNLKAAGCNPEDIDYVLFTHLHYDHIARNTKMVENGKLVATFPNARYLVGKEQYNHWKEIYENPDSGGKEPLSRDMIWPFLLHVKAIEEMGLLDIIDEDFTLHDEIRLYSTYGHSPGSFAIIIESNGDTAWIGGDIANHPIQMTQLDSSTSFDYDPIKAAVEREEVFSKLAGTDILYFGAHFAGEKGGFIKKVDKGYRIINA